MPPGLGLLPRSYTTRRATGVATEAVLFATFSRSDQQYTSTDPRARSRSPESARALEITGLRPHYSECVFGLHKD